jgi:hypothetical protein
MVEKLFAAEISQAVRTRYENLPKEHMGQGLFALDPVDDRPAIISKQKRAMRLECDAHPDSHAICHSD